MPRTMRRAARIKSAIAERQSRELVDRVERETDPFEQAKTFLRKRGFAVSPDASFWTIGNRKAQSDLQLVELAERLGWVCPPADVAMLGRRTGR